jgi:hypothetical protein
MRASLLCLALAGCAAFDAPAPRTVTVDVPVMVPCVQQVPARPAFRTNKQLLELDSYLLMVAIEKDRVQAIVWGDRLAALLMACSDLK